MNNSIIEHRANYHYIQVCEEYLLICSHGKASPHCKALILSVLEQWTNTKRDMKQPLDSIYMTYPLWEQSLYYLYSRSTIIECLGELEEEKKISRKVHRLHGKDTFVYALNTGLIQGLIKALPDKGTKELLPRLDAFKNRRVQKQTRPEVNGIPVQKQTGNASKIKRNVSSNIPSSTTSEDTYDASASDLHVLSDEELLALLQERGYALTNQPELSTPDTAHVDKSSVDPLATSNPIATDTPQPTQHENGSQPELMERPIKPEMPPTSMKLSAEKIVQITEALRCKYYPPEQRAKQLIAAKKIIAKNVNEEQYITAYQDRNDEWWKSTKGPLHVVHMAGKTTNGEMRVLEVLEQVQERISSKVVQFPGRARTGPVDSSYHPELETDADRAARDAKNQANQDKLTRRLEAKEQREREREEQAKLRERRVN